MDHHSNVKVADFGVARMQAPQQHWEEAAATGSSSHPNGYHMDMTGETGTLRWMAPEVGDMCEPAPLKAADGGAMHVGLVMRGHGLHLLQ